MRVVLVDDDADVRLLLRLNLGAEGFEVVGEAADGSAAVTEVGRTQPDGVVLDLWMPGVDGLQALPGVLAACPGTRVVVYTAESRPAVTEDALSLGAQAVVSKDAGRDRLVAALLGDPG